MNIPNEITARVLGKILSEGMRISEVDLTEYVNGEALCALGEINSAVRRENADDSEKLGAISEIMKKYNI